MKIVLVYETVYALRVMKFFTSIIMDVIGRFGAGFDPFKMDS